MRPWMEEKAWLDNGVGRGDTKEGPLAGSCTHTLHAQGHYKHTLTYGYMKRKSEWQKKKNTTQSWAMWNTWPTRGRLPPSNLLFRRWGDWLDSDNETNYVRKAVWALKLGVVSARAHMCVLCFVFSDGKLAGGEGICEGEKAFKTIRKKRQRVGMDRKGGKARVGFYCLDTALTTWRRLFKGSRLWGGGYYFKAQRRSETKASCLSGWT